MINPDEKIDDAVLENGFKQSEKADLCLTMGSNLRITPPADMPKKVAEMGQKLVIVNLLSTPLDDRAALKIKDIS